MGFTLNGNTSLVTIAALAALLVIAITVIVAFGQAIPAVFSDALIALVSAVAGGAVVHRASAIDRVEYKSGVKDVVTDAVHKEVTPP